MFPSSMTIQSYDPDLAKAIADELQRQEDHVELIASENYTSPRVLEAQGAPSNCSAPITPTSSRTPAPRPTSRSTWPC